MKLSEEGTVFLPLSVISSGSFALLPYYARLSWLEPNCSVALYPITLLFHQVHIKRKERKSERQQKILQERRFQFRYHVGYG